MDSQKSLPDSVGKNVFTLCRESGIEQTGVLLPKLRWNAKEKSLFGLSELVHQSDQFPGKGFHVICQRIEPVSSTVSQVAQHLEQLEAGIQQAFHPINRADTKMRKTLGKVVLDLLQTQVSQSANDLVADYPTITLVGNHRNRQQ